MHGGSRSTISGLRRRKAFAATWRAVAPVQYFGEKIKLQQVTAPSAFSISDISTV